KRMPRFHVDRLQRKDQVRRKEDLRQAKKEQKTQPRVAQKRRAGVERAIQQNDDGHEVGELEERRHARRVKATRMEASILRLPGCDPSEKPGPTPKMKYHVFTAHFGISGGIR